MIKMVKRLTLAACALCCMAVVEAMPTHGFYVKAAGGAAILRNSGLRNAGRSIDPMLQIGVGLSLKKGMRADLSFYYTDMRNKALSTSKPKPNQTISMDSTMPKLKQKSILLNLYYDLPTRSLVTPYLTAGAGWSKTRGLATTTTINTPDCPSNVPPSGCPPQTTTKSTPIFQSNGVVFNVGFGFMVPLTQKVSLDLNYKFFIQPKLKSPAPQTSRSLKTHTVMAGLSFAI